MKPVAAPSYRELRDAPPLVSAIFAGRFHNCGRDRVPLMVDRGEFPVEVIRTGQGRTCTKTALLNSLGITPADLVVLAEMEEQAEARKATA
jgi:hypothetical protein